MREQNVSETKGATQIQTQGNADLKEALISAIMELSDDERKELLDMWKGRNQC